MKKVYEVTTGYELKLQDGYDDRISTKYILAESLLEAVGKLPDLHETEEVKEVLESVELVCVIDIE